MAGAGSLKAFINKKYSNEIFNTISSYIEELDEDEFAALDLDLHKLHRIGDYELDDAEVMTASVYDLPGSRVGFDLAVRASILVNEGDHHYDDQVCPIKWFSLRCSGDLDKDLADFTIHDIKSYDGKSDHDHAMYDSLVPVMRYPDYEKRAEEFLRANYRKALVDVAAVDPTEVAKAMGLTVIVRTLTEDCSIFGQVYFRDCDAELYNADTGKMETVAVKAGTILVDPQTYFLYNLGKVNNTIIHECVHWFFHKKAYELERLCSKTPLCMIGCRVVGEIVGGKYSEPLKIMEKQANALTPRIQMPQRAFKTMAEKRIREYKHLTGEGLTINVMEQVIDQLALDFAVSRLAAKIRMIEVGYHEASGTFNYVDGHYVKPYSYRKGSIKNNQTFTISAVEAAIQRRLNPELWRLTENGDYLFIDNHYVYNTPAYICRDADGALALTPYARTHMDECCLVFDLTISGINSINAEYFSICFLNREPCDYTMELVFHNGFENLTPAEQVAKRKKDHEDAMRIRAKMTDSVPECLKLLFDWRDMTQTELSESTGLSTKTISRTLKGDTIPDWKTAVLFCFGLQLPPVISSKLLEVMDCKLNPMNNPDHQWINEALQTRYLDSVEHIRAFLQQYEVYI